MIKFIIQSDVIQDITITTSLTDKYSKVIKKLIDRTISDKKIKGQSGRYYFGF